MKIFQHHQINSWFFQCLSTFDKVAGQHAQQHNTASGHFADSTKRDNYSNNSNSTQQFFAPLGRSSNSDNAAETHQSNL
jgi:uncharacterized protein YutD